MTIAVQEVAKGPNSDEAAQSSFGNALLACLFSSLLHFTSRISTIEQHGDVAGCAGAATLRFDCRLGRSETVSPCVWYSRSVSEMHFATVLLTLPAAVSTAAAGLAKEQPGPISKAAACS